MFLYDFFCKKSVVDKISESKKRILKYDEYNKIDMRDLKDFQEIYAELDLTNEQRVF